MEFKVCTPTFIQFKYFKYFYRVYYVSVKPDVTVIQGIQRRKVYVALITTARQITIHERHKQFKIFR